MRALLALYAAGQIEPEDVYVPQLPRAGTRAQRALHELVKLRFGLQAADGREDEPLMLARSELVNEGVVGTSEGARMLLLRFCEWGILVRVGEMPSLGKGNGTALFRPGSQR